MNFPWGHQKRYNDYSTYLKKLFTHRVQKIAINAGFTCPNRDGSKGVGGCTYCNNQKFNPQYCTPEKSVYQQLDEGIEFFAQKYKTQKYFAYFQAYTNTYDSFENLKTLYDEALSHPKVIGLIIGTRPDCINTEILEYLSEINKTHFVTIEYGLESSNDNTLKTINRGHTFAEAVEAIRLTAEYGLMIGIHLIAGLPDEDKNDILQHAIELSKLPINTLKIHQLQLIKNTVLAQQVKENPNFIKEFAIDEYIDLIVDFLEILNPQIIVERIAGESHKDFLVKKTWGLKNFEIIAKLEKRLAERNTWQGRKF